MMTEEEVSNLYLSQAAAIRTMVAHPEEHFAEALRFAIARIFVVGEILQYPDSEIINEAGIGHLFNEVARAKLEADRVALNQEVERMTRNEPGDDDPFAGLLD